MRIGKFIPKPAKLAMKRFLQPRSFHMSQAGQDLWVFGEVFNEARGLYFVDIGAHDGIYYSNTYVLERRYGWRGICVEADPEISQELKKNRRALCVHACLDSVEGVVHFVKHGLVGGIVSPGDDIKEIGQAGEVIKLKTQTLYKLLKENDAPNEIDYLSADVEGSEERVLGGFDFNAYLFRCMTIERPSEILRKTLKDNGYLLIKEIPGFDCFYLHQSFLPQYRTNIGAFYEKKRLTIRWR